MNLGKVYAESIKSRYYHKDREVLAWKPTLNSLDLLQELLGAGYIITTVKTPFSLTREPVIKIRHIKKDDEVLLFNDDVLLIHTDKHISKLSLKEFESQYKKVEVKVGNLFYEIN